VNQEPIKCVNLIPSYRGDAEYCILMFRCQILIEELRHKDVDCGACNGGGFSSCPLYSDFGRRSSDDGQGRSSTDANANTDH